MEQNSNDINFYIIIIKEKYYVIFLDSIIFFIFKAYFVALSSLILKINTQAINVIKIVVPNAR